MLTLIRGLPGSGKSTLARAMTTTAQRNVKTWENTLHFEADMFFDKDEKNYLFDATKLGEAHEWCLGEARKYLGYGCNVIVSNTFTTERELRPYLSLPFELHRDIPVNIIECHGTFGSVHGVPESSLAKMRARWWPTDREHIFKIYGV